MSQKWKIAGIVLAFIGLPVLYLFEVDTLNRTIHASRMMMISAAIGLLVGILLGYRFQKPVADAVERIRTYAGCIVLLVLIVPLLASLSNRLLSFQAAQPVQVEFVEELPRYSSRFGANQAGPANSYHTFFYKDQQLVKIQTRQSLFSNVQRGDQVTLHIRKGLWGFEIVTILKT